MNIAIFTNNYLPNPYGVSGSIESFRKQFEKMGHTVYIFAPKTKGYVDENPSVFRYPSIDIKYKISFPLAIPFSRKMDKVLEKLDIDIIHSQHPNLLGWVAMKWAKKKKVPLVFTWHTLYDQYAHFAPPFIPKKFAQWWTIRNAVKYADEADQIVVPTPSVKKIIQSWGVTNGNVAAIQTGVEENEYADTDREVLRKKYNIGEDDIVLTLVSRMTEEKNIRFLFKVVSRILKKNENVHFVSTSKGNLTDELQEFVKKEGVEKKVIFTEDSDHKKNVYVAGDIFVYASKSETQGMVISEALYSGLPVVAVVATGVKDMVTNQVNGILVKENVDAFERAVMRLVNDKILRERFSANAKKIAREKYTSKVCAGKMMKLYKEVINGS